MIIHTIEQALQLAESGPNLEVPWDTSVSVSARAAEMEQNALKAVIDLVEVSELVNLPELLEHRVIEECVSLF